MEAASPPSAASCIQQLSPNSPADLPTPAWEDASFGLDPSVDIGRHLESRQWIPKSMTVQGTHEGGQTAGMTPILSTAKGNWHALTSRLSGSRSRYAGSRLSRSSSLATTHQTDAKADAKSSASSTPSADLASQRTQVTSHPPTGSLTLSFLTPASMSQTRRWSLLASSAFINLVLPFMSGALFGTGEIVARIIVAPGLLLAWRWTMMSAKQRNG